MDLIPFGLTLAQPLSAFSLTEEGQMTSNGGTAPPLPPNEDENSDDVFSSSVL